MNEFWHDEAWADYEWWRGQDRKTFLRINQIIRDIERKDDRFTGRPEPLGGDWAGWWGVRIDSENCLVFRFADQGIVILSCRGHHGDWETHGEFP